jgi:hypothetical protein
MMELMNSIGLMESMTIVSMTTGVDGTVQLTLKKRIDVCSIKSRYKHFLLCDSRSDGRNRNVYREVWIFTTS